MKGIEIKASRFFLKFKYPFQISAGMRSETPVVFIKTQSGNYCGYGEAALPPYLKETQQSVINFIQNISVSDFNTVTELMAEIEKIFLLPDISYPAMAAIEMSLWDLLGIKLNLPVSKILNIEKNHTPFCTFTIGMDSSDVIKQKIESARDFEILKIKLGGKNDKEIIETIRALTDKPVCIDANQGWKTYDEAMQMIDWLATKSVLFVEQPMPKENKKDYLHLKKNSPLPLIADESLQTINDLDFVTETFSGINVKLMKCGGIIKAKEIIDQAKKSGLKILIGCMSESSCGVAAAAQLAPLAHWIDLDGPLLINNNPFDGVKYKNGKLILNEKPGLGITSREILF